MPIPNLFVLCFIDLGEIMVWIGIYSMSFSALEGIQHIAIISPIFTAWLILKVSGVPTLERSANKKWGKLPEFNTYRANTAKLIPYIW
eukprot:m.16014 g.16014  ORF g.16014 m.16014 type:complete len:88 (+) comp7970_c0_seq1:74-337(+)